MSQSAACRPRCPRCRLSRATSERTAADPEPRQRHYLDRRARRHDRLVHGDPEHPDHQRLAAQHRRRHRHRRRQRLVDLDLVSDRRDRRDPAHRLSHPGVLVPPLHAGERGAVRGVFGRLRLHPRSAVDDRDARPAGICRRRADPDGVHAGADQAAEAAAADRACDLRAVRHLRARDRTDHRRLSHRELRLADHLLRQRRADHRDGERALSDAGAAADAAFAPEGGRLGRHRHHGDRAVGAADRARGGQQGRLVLLALHPAAGRHRCGEPDAVRLDRAYRSKSR